MDMVVNQFEVFYVDLNPTVGAEINKVRPCVILSPDALNNHLDTVIIAPLTSSLRSWPTRIAVFVSGKNGQVCLDQLRAVDKKRLSAFTRTKIVLSADEINRIKTGLSILFS